MTTTDHGRRANQGIATCAGIGGVSVYIVADDEAELLKALDSLNGNRANPIKWDPKRFGTVTVVEGKAIPSDQPTVA